MRLRRQALIRGHREYQRVHPRRPPEEAPEAIIELSKEPADESFITGNGIAARCRYVLNFDVLRVNEHVEHNWWFCKSEFLEYFFRRLAPREPFVLFSHNSDRAIDSRFLRELERPELIAWFAKNPVIEHPKLHALPIGIANPRWRHGDQAALTRAQRASCPRTRLFEVSFNVATNGEERTHCIAQTGLQPVRHASFDQYLQSLASSCFCISPAGNGIDCHRTWETLYVGTIPVVTRSILTEQHGDLPMIVLDDWSEFRTIDFSFELYERVRGDWDPDSLRLDRYFERIEATLRRAREASG